MSVLLILGASTVEGFGAVNGGWADSLKKHLYTRHYSAPQTEPLSVYNLGISGNTAAMVLERMQREIAPRLWFPKQNIYVLISVGLNDSRAEGTPDAYTSDIPTYQKYLTAMIAEAQAYHAKILFIGLTPNNDAQTMPMPILPYYYSQTRVHEFDIAMSEVAAQQGLPKVELFDAMLAEDDWQKRFLYADGLHPNAAGHEWMLEKILPAVERLL